MSGRSTPWAKKVALSSDIGLVTSSGCSFFLLFLDAFELGAMISMSGGGVSNAFSKLIL
jgi:hypothetical protein